MCVYIFVCMYIYICVCKWIYFIRIKILIWILTSSKSLDKLYFFVGHDMFAIVEFVMDGTEIVWVVLFAEEFIYGITGLFATSYLVAIDIVANVVELVVPAEWNVTDFVDETLYMLCIICMCMCVCVRERV